MLLRSTHYLTILAVLGTGAAACSGVDAGNPAPASSTAEGDNAIEPVGSGTVVASGDPRIVTQVNFEDGRSFRFIEMEAGTMTLGELNPVGVLPTARRTNIRGLTPLEIFERIAPDAQVPETLIEANSRFIELKASKVAPSVPLRSVAPVVRDVENSDLVKPGDALEAKAIDDHLCPQAWFSSALCPGAWGQDWTVCTPYRSGVNNIVHNDQNSDESIICTYRGSTDYRVRTRPWYTWSTPLLVGVPEGTYYWSYTNKSENYWDVDYDYEFRGDAGSGGYHMSGWGYNKGNSATHVPPFN